MTHDMLLEFKGWEYTVLNNVFVPLCVLANYGISVKNQSDRKFVF